MPRAVPVGAPDPSAPRASRPGLAARVLLLAFLAWEASRQLRSHDFEFSVFGGVIFGVHELGHLVFAPFGDLLSVAGGSIAQLALPVAALALFQRRRDRFGVAVCACWLAVSLGQLAVYIGDARAESLDLVSFSPEGGGHDWNYLLERWYLLKHDVRIAGGTRTAGWLALLGGLALGLAEVRRLGRGGAPRPSDP